MTDLTIRGLERAASIGDLNDSMRLLVARSRSGDRDAGARLRLAAYCGHEVAERVHGVDACYKVRWRKECTFPGWLTGLFALGADLDVGEREVRCDCTEFSTDPCNGACCNKACKGIGKRLVPWDGTAYLLQRCAIIAGRLVHDSRNFRMSGVCDRVFGCYACKALDAAWDHLLCGTLAAERVWELSIQHPHAQESLPVYLLGPPITKPNPIQAILASTRMLDPRCHYCRGAGQTDEGVMVPCSDCRGTGRVDGELLVRKALQVDLIAWALNV